MTRKRRNLTCLIALVALSFGFADSARASFHLMEISEVLAGYDGDCDVQYVELRMLAAGQNEVGGQSLYFFDATDDLLGSVELPTDVTSAASGDHILIATAAFAAASSVTPDFVLPTGLLRPHGGRVSFTGPAIASAVDSVAFGIYDEDNGTHGMPAPALSVLRTQSLTRTASGEDNAASFELAAPTPTNNAGDTGDISLPDPDCFFEDDFADLDNWDLPTPGAGLDLEPCLGVDVVADIGSGDLGDERLHVHPSVVDELDLGYPIGFLALTADAAASFATEESYRVRFDMLAQPGVIGGGIQLGQHHFFDEELGVLDAGPETQAGGVGFTWSFDCPHVLDAACDHVHPLVRTACLQDGSVEGPGEAQFPDGLLMTSEVSYTVIIDVEGDDVDGPFTIRGKLFPTDDPEPEGYLASWTTPLGLGVSADEEFDHGILFIAIGDSNAALEIGNLSVCEVPPSGRQVRDLTCVRTLDDEIELFWTHPFDGVGGDIDIVVNDVLVDTIDGSETSYVIEEAPQEDARISVINSSCIPTTCEVCYNSPPIAVIEGPESEVLGDVLPLSVRLDGASSDNGEGSSAGLFWSWRILEQPADGGARIQVADGPGSRVDLVLEAEGTYVVELTVSDEGCDEDPISRQDIATHTLVVTSSGSGLFRRGDADGNGILELTDAVRILNFLFSGGEAPGCLDAGDADDNGRLELTDAINDLGFLFLGNAPPPAPGPTDCGVDPTEDGLVECEYESC